VELQVDPFVEAHRANLLRVAGPGTKSQSVERLDYLLVGGELTMIEPGTGSLRCDRRSERSRAYSGGNEGFRPAH
jgi:hypothetical protein